MTELALGPLTADEEATLRWNATYFDPAEDADWDNLTILRLLATLDRERATPDLRGAHDLVPFPPLGKFAEVRMIYCRRCGASQPVESAAREALPPCSAAIASPVATDAAIEAAT